MTHVKRIFAALLVAFLVVAQVSTIPDVAVMGGSNLTTVGAVPYVSSVGVLASDGSFLRSATGRYTLYDPTATTGVTTLTVRAGAGNTDTDYPFIVKNSSNKNVMRVDKYGTINAPAFQDAAINNTFSLANAVLNAGSALKINWSSTTAADGTKDLGLARSSANNLGVTNGSSTTYWTLGAGGILAGTDNSIDIGANGANRPRAIYVAGAGTFGGALTAGGGASITGGNLSMNGNGISAVGALNYIANVSLPIGNVTHTTTISGGANVRIAPTYNTSGTGIAFTDFLVNRTETSLGTSPGAQYLIDAQVGGTSKFSVSNTGTGTFAGDVTVSGATGGGSAVYAQGAGYIGWSGRSRLYSASDGVIGLYNSGATDFTRLQFGGTTSSFPALKRNSTALSARLADDSGNAPISASLFRTCQTEADGCWQFIPSGSDMLLQYRTGGAWVTKATWAP